MNVSKIQKLLTLLNQGEKNLDQYRALGIINESAAKLAHDMNHTGDYVVGSATAAYVRYVRKAVELADKQKAKVDSIHYDKIDALVERYAARMADVLNSKAAIDTQCPSVLISGAGNFPTHKKAKQNAARDRNFEEYDKVQKILDKIKSAGMGGISADDSDAAAKLKAKLAKLESEHELRKKMNAYYRKHKTFTGMPELSEEEAKKYTRLMEGVSGAPFESYVLSSDTAEIRRLKQRIADLEKVANTEWDEWTFDGGEVVANKDENRLQLIFDDKPDDDVRDALKHHGFRWSPRNQAWQRQLTRNAYRSLRSMMDKIPALKPVATE